MSTPSIFISYSHVDELWKERLSKHLGIAEQQGLLETWDDRKIVGGGNWFSEITNAIECGSIAVLLVSHNSLTSKFILNEEIPRMLKRYGMNEARLYPIIIEYCDWEAVDWLKQFNLRPRDGQPVGINKDGRRTEEKINYDLKEIAKEIRLMLPSKPLLPVTHERLFDECPYLGLDAFTEDKAHLFFGRDDFAEALFAKVKRNNFVALIGPSGCGKSSVVQAGLFPRLRKDIHPWEMIIFPPQEDPILSLATGFVWYWRPRATPAVNTNAVKKLVNELENGQGLTKAIHDTVPVPDGRLLIVIDQFEELFTLCTETDRRLTFLKILLEAKETAPVTIMITLRADFMGQAQSLSPAFSQLLDDGIVSHRPFSRADLEAIITGPAQLVGIDFEPGLVNLILRELTDQSDSLPLLEYALKEMWRKRQRHKMGHQLYEAVGKVESAISQHADAVLRELPEAEQTLALRALTRLVRVAGEDNETDTRLRLPLHDLKEAERIVLQEFVKARLLVTKGEEHKGVGTIEVTHEALIRHWEKLREALDLDREFLKWRQRLDSRRKAWEQNRRANKWLLFGGERDEAVRWLSERRQELTNTEIEFIIWDDRPQFQIERILSQSPNILPFVDIETLKSWFTILGLCHRSEWALAAAREIEDEDSRAQALSSLSEALGKRGSSVEAMAAAREIKDTSFRIRTQSLLSEALVKAGLAHEALAAAREIESESSRARALSSLSEPLVKAGLAAETLTAAREIGDARSRVLVLNSLFEALKNAELANEAHKAATEALAAACEIENTSSRLRALSLLSEVLVNEGLATEACEVAIESLAASKIEDGTFCAEALGSLSELLVKAGSVAEALAAAREIKDEASHARALSSLSASLMKAGLAAEACEVATEALVTARKIESVYFRSQTLRSLSKTLAKAGLAAEALTAAREIEDMPSRAQALSLLSEAMVKAGLAAEALVAAREIEDMPSRARALSLLPEPLVKAGLAAEALAAAREIEDASSRVRALYSLSQALGKAGLAAWAMAAAREIGDASSRARALCSVSEPLMKAGMTTEARRAATEAMAAAREVGDASSRARTLRSLSELLSKAGLETDACEAATESLAAAREIEDESSRAEALRSLSEPLINMGLAIEARQSATESLAAAREIEDESSRAEALRSLSEALGKAGLATESLAAAREIEDVSSRVRAFAQALRLLSEALGKARVMTETRKAATKALAVAREIEDVFSRSLALIAVSNFWVEQGEVGEARNLVQETLDAIRKVFDDSNRSEITQHLAVILARLHSYRDALETANKCSNSSHQLIAYTAILREYHIEHDPGLAKLFAD